MAVANIGEVQMAGNDANLNARAAPPEVELAQGGGMGDWGAQTWGPQPQMQPAYVGRGATVGGGLQQAYQQAPPQ